jgi:hypothetical protein
LISEDLGSTALTTVIFIATFAISMQFPTSEVA